MELKLDQEHSFVSMQEMRIIMKSFPLLQSIKLNKHYNYHDILNQPEDLSVLCKVTHLQLGGHNIAAGAQVASKNLEPFLKLVNKLVKEKLEMT